MPGEVLYCLLFQLKAEFQEKLKAAIDTLLKKLYHGLEREDDHDYIVYTGMGG
jgi:tRNA A22 N-methylase